jgi:hypothetical protein
MLFDSRQRYKIFLVSLASSLVLGPTRLWNEYWELLPVVKRPGREADYI